MTNRLGTHLRYRVPTNQPKGMIATSPATTGCHLTRGMQVLSAIGRKHHASEVSLSVAMHDEPIWGGCCCFAPSFCTAALYEPWPRRGPWRGKTNRLKPIFPWPLSGPLGARVSLAPLRVRAPTIDRVLEGGLNLGNRRGLGVFVRPFCPGGRSSCTYHEQSVNVREEDTASKCAECKTAR